MRFLGVDAAWGSVNPSGVCALDPSGVIVDAGWTNGLDATADWVQRLATPDTLLFVDAPLVVTNPSGQRLAETEVSQRYMRWQVGANSTHQGSARLAGVKLRERLEAIGWRYDDGWKGPPASGYAVSECYPFTTVVGAPELGYEDERPRYKHKRAPVIRRRRMRMAEFWPICTRACDELIQRVAALAGGDPSLDLCSHENTRGLVDSPSPARPREYKPREDLLDAVLCAWTAAMWHRYGFDRCQVLGHSARPDCKGRVPTIIAPARPEQRRDP